MLLSLRELGLSEHSVHFWLESRETLVERNEIIDCDRGVGFGLGTSSHFGGVIRNNMVYQGLNHSYSKVGTDLESTSNIDVYYITIFMSILLPMVSNIVLLPRVTIILSII